MKQKYNRNIEKHITQDCINVKQEKIKMFQVAFYELRDGRMECFDESFYPPEKEEYVRSYLKYRSDDEIRVFAIYEDGYSEELM
jgi:hypothetical protein